MIRSLFEAIVANPAAFVDARRGSEFEDRIEDFLRRRMGYSRIRSVDVENWRDLKQRALLKSNDQPIANDCGIDSSYIYQPNGSQNYPDFMVFENDEVICIEVKFADKQKPVWNSGLPRPNGFYILGWGRRGDATFFRGNDVVSAAESARLHSFFDRMRAEEQAFNRNEMSGQKHGFVA